MPKWEYKALLRMRNIEPQENKQSYYLTVSDWNVDLQTELPKLGAEGWELVSVVPRSSSGSWGANGPNTNPWYPITGGVTDEELWVFKRQLA